MKKSHVRLLSLLLAAAMLISCVPLRASALSLLEWLFSDSKETSSDTSAEDPELVRFSDMVYTRPDLDELQSLLDEAASRAAKKNAPAILDAVYAFYDAYDWFYTNSALADIHYSADLNDDYWAEENEFCTASASQVDQMLTELNTTLAASPCRSRLEKLFFGEGFFDSYDVDGDWTPDEQLVELLNREAELVSQYYTQSAKTTSLFGSIFPPYKAMAQTLVDLIRVRNTLAAYLGYDSYEAYANDYLYARDYTPEQVAAYLEEVREKLTPLYLEAEFGTSDYREYSEADTLEYVRRAAQAMGGTVLEAFELMESAELYDITKSSSKYNSSFELYLPSYQVPFIFMNPDGSAFDQLTFAHEFGHFCNDYALGGSYVGVDVSEIFSQAMEYLSLCYVPADESLIATKMVDSLCTYVEQACYARFEQEMYRIEETELSVQALADLYADTAAAYGLTDYGYFDSMDFVTITHFYTNPMYVSSYVFSNDAAMQIYQLELDNAGVGLECYLNNLDNAEGYFLAFLESAGLESPFADGRVEEAAQIFRQILKIGGTFSDSNTPVFGQIIAQEADAAA